jgi:cobalt/nickel transport system permease protein
VAKVTGKTELAAPEGGVASAARRLQQETAILPDYDFKKPDNAGNSAKEANGTKPVGNLGTSTAGLVGAALTLAVVALLGFGLHKRQKVP